jgi:hypothetical protein
MTDELPSIPIKPTNRLVHETRFSKDLGKIRAWRSSDIEEQHRAYLEAKRMETFWNLRMKGRP